MMRSGVQSPGPTVWTSEALGLGGVWLPLLNFSRCPIEYLTHAWSIKYRLITKLTA